MSSGPLDGLRQIAEFAHPSTFKRLSEAGALSPKGLIAIAQAFPWLLGRGASLGILAQMNATVLGDKPAVHDRNGTISFAELHRRSNQVAHALDESRERSTDKPRVAMLLRNGREFAEVALGSQKRGLVACPLNTWAKPKELTATLKSSDPFLLIYDTAHADQVAKSAPEDLAKVFVGDPKKALPGSVDYEEFVGTRPESPLGPFTRDRGSPKVVIHTSGTTGTPKGAARDSAAAGIGVLANFLAIVPYQRDDVVVCPAPMFHSFGLFTFTFATALGQTLVLPEKFDPEGSLSLIEKHGAGAASFVPVMLRRIVSLDDATKSRYDLSSLRVVLVSGSALSEDLRHSAMDLFGPVLYDLYGSTEVGWAAIATPDDMRSRKGTVGRAVPATELAIFSPDGDRLPSGDVGEIYVKSDILFEGYTSGETRDEREGYMSVGDTGRLDDDGYLFVEGRVDDMVVVGGENIYPVEIEGAIESISGVSEAAVIGIDDKEYGKVLAAFVVGDTTPEKVIATCRAELASYKVPKRVAIVDDMPRTGTGKVIKSALLEKLEQK
jgi:acyl-CoA synthetase (AMP-forming)/AMP-acid ligase II